MKFMTLKKPRCLSFNKRRPSIRNIVKRCFHCHGFGNTSKICYFITKCAKRSKANLANYFPEVWKISPIFANSSGSPPVTFRSCPKSFHNSFPETLVLLKILSIRLITPHESIIIDKVAPLYT